MAVELEARVDSRQIKLDPRNASPGEPAPDTADVPKTVKELSAEITAAIRKDMVTLSVQLAAKANSAELALPGEETPESAESEKSGTGAEKNTPNSQDAVEYSWSQYLELLTGNMQMEAMQAARRVQIDWTLLLNWMPNPGKSLEENMQDLAFHYQTLWRIITQNFSGGQQMELLARLDMLMMSKLELLSQMDLMKLYDFLITNGQRDAAESIRTSVQRAGFDMAHGKNAQTAQGTAAQNLCGGNESGARATAGGGTIGGKAVFFVNGTPHGEGKEAARNTDALGTDSARFSKTLSRQGNLFYTPGELRQAKHFVENLAPPKYGILPETELGQVLAQVDAGLMTLKTQVFLERADISPGFAETMRQAMDQFLAAHQASAGHEADFGDFQRQSRREQHTAASRRGTTQYRSPAVLVAERMSETYARTGDAREAVLAGVRYARELTVGKEQPYRDSEQLFWKAILFGAGEMASGKKAPMQQIRENWNQFVSGMDLRRGKSAELYIGAYESGGLQMSRGQGGNMRGAVTNAAMMAFLLIPPAAALFAGKSALALGLMVIDLAVAFVLHKVLSR